MTAERFTYYLNNPEHLYQISYQELKSLVVQYPYCQNLRYLLVTKSQIEDAEEYEKDLQLAATYSVDRSHLYELIHKEKTTTDESENFVLNEDYLELKNISPTTETPMVANPEPIVLEQITGESGIATSTPQDDLEDFPNTPTLEEEVEMETEINIPQEGKTIEEPADLEEITEMEESEIHQLPESEKPQAAIPEPKADNISDESEMVNYMKKPKRSKSVIEQLLGKYIPPTALPTEETNLTPDEESMIHLEDELESPVEAEDNFMDLSPVKEEPTLGREVLFEITNKTDQEMDALMQKTQMKKEEEESNLDENTVTMDHFEEDKEVASNEQPSSPTPKTSFKSYMEQFQPPGMIEELEEEKELANAIDEAVEEEHLEPEAVPKKDKKKKPKKLKKMSTAVKLKTDKKKDKGKKKKSKKSKVIKEAKKSLEENDDVLSETLAELLAQQGSRKKAIQMYKRLSLIFPEKSSFFAKKIKKLKK